MKKRMIAVLLASTMAFSVTACGKTDTAEKTSSEKIKQPTELSLYTYYADAAIERVDRTLESMKKIYPDLTINIEHRTDSDGSVLKTRAAVGELPDIFECTGQLTDILVKSDDLAQLDDAIEKAQLFDKFLDGAFDTKKDKDGHYYAVQPEAPQACLMYYNIEVFEKLGLTPPKNYDELKATVKKLSDNNLIPLSLFAQQKWPGLQMYDMAIVGEGQPLGLSGLEDGSTKITDDAYVNAAKKLTELVKLGLIGKGALNTNASQAFELLETGKAGLLVNGAWFFTDAAVGGYGDKVGYLEYNPFADAGNEEKSHYTMSGGTGSSGGMAVSAKSKNMDFAKEVLMVYIQENEKSGALLGTINVLKDAPDPEKPRAKSFQAYVDSIPNFKSTTKYEWSLNNQELIVALEDSSELLLTGTYTPEKFIEDLNASIAEIVG